MLASPESQAEARCDPADRLKHLRQLKHEQGVLAQGLSGEAGGARRQTGWSSACRAVRRRRKNSQMAAPSTPAASPGVSGPACRRGSAARRRRSQPRASRGLPSQPRPRRGVAPAGSSAQGSAEHALYCSQTRPPSLSVDAGPASAAASTIATSRTTWAGRSSAASVANAPCRREPPPRARWAPAARAARRAGCAWRGKRASPATACGGRGRP